MSKIDELQAAVHRAYDAMGAAWAAVNFAQEQMRAAGVPDLIVDHLEEARLACMTTNDFPAVADALEKLDALLAAERATPR